MKITTITELEGALKTNFDVVQHYHRQVAVKDDLSIFMKFLHDNEATTRVVTHLKREKMRAKGIHPSSACKKKVCLLKLYYECTFEVPPLREFSQKSQLTWDIGTLLHDTHQTWFKAMYGNQFESEVPLARGLIKSHTDGIFTFSNYRFIIEIKSIKEGKEGSTYGWDSIQAKPMEDNVRQAHFYMSLSDVPYALIFYIGKNNSEYVEHAVTFNPNLWKEMEDKVINPVIQAVKTSTPPPANPGWDCRWCDFAHGCPKKGGKDDATHWQ